MGIHFKNRRSLPTMSAAPTPPTPSMFAMVKQLAIIPLVMGLNKIDFEKPENEHRIFYVQCFFAVAQAINVILIQVIMGKIRLNNDTARVKVPPVVQFGQEVQPGKDLSVPEYDKEKAQEQIKQIVTGILILGAMCYYYNGKLVLPLVIQGVMVFLNLPDNQLFCIYILGREATGTLKRPWAPPNPFGMPAAPAETPETPAGSDTDAKIDTGASKKEN